MKRAIIIVLDSVGAGEAADAAAFGDVGANTLGHVLQATGTPLPHLERLGLGRIIPLASVAAVAEPQAAYGRLAPQSSGKDTTSGHWEMAGLILDKPLPTYPDGFPEELLRDFAAATGRPVLGNIVASGTKIIEDLGPEQAKTGAWIVYTSADSVFQIAAHEGIIPLSELYAACETARALLQGEHGLGRVIARPYIGEPGSYRRTENRRDFSLVPPPHGLLARVRQAGLSVVSVGKIADIFAGRDISEALEAHNNTESMTGTLQALEACRQGLIFVNLVDFDSLYGHRNNPQGYAQALADFDAWLPQLLAKLEPEDMLFVTADHGNDPTTPSTDHDRENVPLLVYGQGVRPVDLGLLPTFADLGATCADYLGAQPLPAGQSFLALLSLK